MQFHSDEQVIAVAYDSVGEPGRNQPAVGENSRAWVEVGAESKTGDEAQRWFGAPSYAVMKERLQKGWPEGVERLMKLALAEVPAPQSLRRKKVRSDFGDSLDMQRVYRGDLAQAWERTQKRASNNPPTITILVNLSCLAYVNSDELFWRGAAVLRLTEALSIAGYNVAIWGTCASFDAYCYDRHANVQFVPIKDSDSPLDISQLASVICMAGYKRYFLHKGRVELGEKFEKSTKVGLGDSSVYARIDQITMHALRAFPHIPQEVYYMPQIHSQQEAESWISKQLTKLTAAHLGDF